MKTVGIIGCGNMGAAIAEGIKKEYFVAVFDKDAQKTAKLSEILVTQNPLGLVKQVETVILAVKPQDFSALLEEIKPGIKDKLVISIAAGINTVYLENKLGNSRVIRIMPNLPAKIGQGLSCLTKGAFAKRSDLELAKKIFKAVGEVLVIDEKLMNAATAISGSGPGFLFSLLQGKDAKEQKKLAQKEFLPRLKEAARKQGFSQIQAVLLAGATTAGSLALIAETGLSAEALCSQVTSKGGTTAAGLEKLQGSVDNLDAAVEAAARRAEELSSMYRA